MGSISRPLGKRQRPAANPAFRFLATAAGLNPAARRLVGYRDRCRSGGRHFETAGPPTVERGFAWCYRSCPSDPGNNDNIDNNGRSEGLMIISTLSPAL